LGAGLINGLIFVLIGQMILPDWPVSWFWLGAATIMVRIAADNYFQLAYGLDDMIRWVARESLRFLVQFALVLPLFLKYSIPGALLGVLLTNVIFFGYGLSWAWRLFKIKSINLKILSPYLKFGAAFFVAAAMMMGSQRFGSVLLAIWRVPAEEIGYFDLAFNIFMILAGTMSQLVLAFMPTLTQWKTVHQEKQIRLAINVLWKACVLGALIVVAVVWVLADELIPLILGAAYSPVVGYLRIIILGIVPLALGQMNFVIANVYKKPRLRLWSSLVTLVVYVGFTIALIPTYGGLAPAIASLISVIALAFVTYWSSRPVLTLVGWRTEIAFVCSRLNHSQ
ncbi:polysaccharide biosynthesis C-terminal domain-containing protein, partial [Chloroflexota bacterium]